MKAGTDSHVPLSPAALQILLALGEKDLHGYGIIQTVRIQSGGQVKIGSGTLYDNLKKFMDQGLVCDIPADSDEDKRLYRLTDSGQAALASEIARLDRVIKEARRRVPSLRPRRTA